MNTKQCTAVRKWTIPDVLRDGKACLLDRQSGRSGSYIEICWLASVHPWWAHNNCCHDAPLQRHTSCARRKGPMYLLFFLPHRSMFITSRRWLSEYRTMCRCAEHDIKRYLEDWESILDWIAAWVSWLHSDAWHGSCAPMMLGPC